MGKSGWRYFVPFQPDIQAALDGLRADVFRRRDFVASRRAARANTIDEAVRLAGEDGTHSILDVAVVGEQPVETPYWTWLILSRRAGKQPSDEECRARQLADLRERRGRAELVPLSGPQLVEYFGTDRPTRAAVETTLAGLPPANCFYVVVHDDQGRPSELCFAGCSGD